MWKDFFYFSRRERRGILILIVLIAGVFLGKYLFTPKPFSPDEISNESGKNIENKEIVLDKSNKQTVQNSDMPAYQRSYNTPAKPKQQIEKRTYYSFSSESPTPPKQNQYPVTDKFTAGTIIDINTCDTLMLMKIPGVGSAYAKRIASYRNLLGGYVRLEQLQEVYGMYEELYDKIIPYLQTDTSQIITIHANTASLDKLRSHPYINFYQAKAIVEMRKKKGKLESIHELYLLEEFTTEDLERIKHYLAF